MGVGVNRGGEVAGDLGYSWTRGVRRRAQLALVGLERAQQITMGRGKKKGKEKKPSKKELEAQRKKEEAEAAAKAAKGDDDGSGSEEEEVRQLSRPMQWLLLASNHAAVLRVFAGSHG